MDRRQLLFGMTALGIASRFDLNNLLHAQDVNASGTTSDTAISDRGRDGLRGLVKQCIMDGGVTEYDINGNILSRCSQNQGDSNWISRWTYDNAGHLQKFTSTNTNGPNFEESYLY